MNSILKIRNKFVNSKNEFQQITKVSDSLLNIIAPYFKFPDWVVKRNQKMEKETSSLFSSAEQELDQTIPKEIPKTIDINKATVLDFQSIDGIGGELSERIINYRKKLSGGEIRKIYIAKSILTEADVLLLDEPTNHIDLPTIDWLERKLLYLKKTMIIKKLSKFDVFMKFL